MDILIIYLGYASYWFLSSYFRISISIKILRQFHLLWTKMTFCTCSIYSAQVTMEAILPTSANWYCSRIIDGNEQGIVCIGAKNSIDVWQVSSVNVTQHIATIRAHEERVVGISICRQQQLSSDVILPMCCSAGEDGKVRMWNLNSKEMIKEHNFHKVE